MWVILDTYINAMVVHKNNSIFEIMFDLSSKVCNNSPNN